MSKHFLYTVIVLVTAIACVTKWHHQIDRETFALQLDSDLYVMKVLAEKLDARDDYIARLEGFLTSLEIETVEPVEPTITIEIDDIITPNPTPESE